MWEECSIYLFIYLFMYFTVGDEYIYPLPLNGKTYRFTPNNIAAVVPLLELGTNKNSIGILFSKITLFFFI